MDPEKIIELYKSTARHLIRLKGGIDSGQLNEDLFSNVEKNHFVFNMDN